jgi:hypothetical protein
LTTRFEIHPSIGIARVGTSAATFTGPEPGEPAPTTFRDAEGALLRQAARFRVFECERDERGTLLSASEVNPDEADISWTVHLVNRKAASNKFQGVQRNPGEDPIRLIIDPGTRTVSGPGSTARFDTSRFRDTAVFLGDLSVDVDGRLRVAGGFGRAGSEPATEMRHFANNHNWWDDTSDGAIEAVVRTADGKEHLAAPSWVIVGPPDFAPSVLNFVTVYDVARDAATTRGWLPTPQLPSFTRDIYPILSRPYGYSWVSKPARDGHRGWTPDSPLWTRLSDPKADARTRNRLLEVLRRPDGPANTGRMPRLNDNAIAGVLPPAAWQYDVLVRWAAGDFVGDWGQDLATAELLPDALDRVALQAASGGAFFPGIEVSEAITDPALYAEPYRLDASALVPGSLTEGCAVPWQADFIACHEENGRGWWPSQRPDHVHVDPADIGGEPVAWVRGIKDRPDMVEHWHELGVVVEKPGPAGKPVYVEAERRLAEPQT